MERASHIEWNSITTCICRFEKIIKSFVCTLRKAFGSWQLPFLFYFFFYATRVCVSVKRWLQLIAKEQHTHLGSQMILFVNPHDDDVDDTSQRFDSSLLS